MRCTKMLILLAIAFLSFNANASIYYQSHPIPQGWNVTFQNESSVEMTDGNSTIGLYNTTIPEIVSEWVNDLPPSPEADLTRAVSKRFAETKGIKLDNPPACRTFTTNQGLLHPFGADTIRMTFCDCGDYLFTWKTPGIENDYTCLYARFRGNYSAMLVDGHRQKETLPSILYEYLS